MGLRPLEPGRWLDVDARRGTELAEKHRLVERSHDRVFAARAGSEAAGAELLDAVLSDLAAHHPGLVSVGGDGMLTEHSTGARIDPGAHHPLDVAGRLVQEDLCLMTTEHTDGAWVLAAASVCFPSRWRLADKVGGTLLDIHRPVPGYETALDRPTRALFDRLSPARRVWRLNWTLIDDPGLHQPDAEGRGRVFDAGADPSRALWLRVERQTLVRIGERPAVAFTIRTYVTALADLVVAEPHVVGALRAQLATVPADTIAYTGWGGFIEPVLAWLAGLG